MTKLAVRLLYVFFLLLFISLVDPFGMLTVFLNLATVAVLGWISFIAQTLPRVRPDAASIATFLLCFGAFYGLVHFFGGMIYTHITSQRGEAKPWRAKWSGAIVCACVLLFAAGMSGVGLFYSTQQIAQSPEPFFTGVRRYRLTVYATKIIDRAEKSNWDAAQLRESANSMLREYDGQARFLVIDDPKKPGECAALVGYLSALPWQATIYFRNGDSRSVDLRVDDLEKIAASGQ